jgi:hypothetical protein
VEHGARCCYDPLLAQAVHTRDAGRRARGLGCRGKNLSLSLNPDPPPVLTCGPGLFFL